MKTDINDFFTTDKFPIKFKQFVDFQQLMLQDSSQPEHHFEEVLLFVDENNFIGENKGQFYEFLVILCHVIQIRPNSKELILNILNHYIKEISMQFSSEELFSIFSQDKQLILSLYEHNCITIDTLKNKYNETSWQFPFFYPEFSTIFDTLTENQQLKMKSIEIEIEKQYSSEIGNLIKCRKEGHSELEIAQLIRNDDITNFSIYVSKPNFNLNLTIPPSVFESNPLLQSNPTLIEYSSFFGSIQIFKFLWLQGLKVTKRLFNFAIAGRSGEIIHIIENSCKIDANGNPIIEKYNKNNLQIDNNVLIAAVESQTPEIFDYFIQKYNSLNLTDNILFKTVKSLNFLMFNHIIQYMHDIGSNCPIIMNNRKYDTKIENHSIADILKFKKTGKNLLHEACIYGNLEIIDLLCNCQTKNDCILFDVNDKDICSKAALHYACKYGYIDIAKLLNNYYGNLLDWNIQDNGF